MSSLAAPPPLIAAPSGERLRVLIADDSATSRRLLQAVLEKWGYEVTPAEDGASAWEVLRQDDPPSLAILDWMMPGLSGPDVCKKVRDLGRTPYTYILLLTSRSQKEDLIEGLTAGADDYVTKPFDNNELRVRLGPARRILELQSALLATQSALHEQATRDSLTGLWNRRAILEMLDRELARAMRDHDSVGVVLGDLDHFKSINDCYGHIAGDATLREVAGQLQYCVRHYDGVGRYGGEEFLIVLPGCDLADSEHTALRMRAGVQRIPASLFGVRREITISFGATAYEGGAPGQPNMESLVRTADEALYRAKEQGRNRVVTAPMLRSME